MVFYLEKDWKFTREVGFIKLLLVRYCEVAGRGLSEIHGEVLPPDGRGSGELRS